MGARSHPLDRLRRRRWLVLHDRLEAVANRAAVVIGDATPDGRRRSALALIGVMAAVGFALGITVGGSAEALGEQFMAFALLLLVVGLVMLPLPERIRWPWVAVLCPLCFAVGVRPLDSPEAFIGLLVVPVAWIAAFLPVRLSVLHLVVATCAVWWVLAQGEFAGRTAAATGLWLVIFLAVSILVGALARGLRRAQAEVDGIGDAIGIHFYRGALQPDGTYVETYTGAGLERLLGGRLPHNADAGQIWDDAVHPDDHEDMVTWLRSIAPGRSAERDYRLIGMDGATRWIRDRARVVSSRDGRVVHEGICADVTERKHAEEGLARVRRDLQDVVETIEEVVLRYEPGSDGWHATASGPRLAELLGETAARAPDPLGTAALALDRVRLAQHRARALREGRSEVEVRVAGPDGTRRWVAERLRTRDGQRNAPVVAATLSDVTERRLIAAELASARDEAERRARTDPLTNVANRLHFAELLDVAFERHQRDATPFGLVLVDVDRFKDVNDAFGHLAGDDVLAEVAARLATRVRGSDTVARWGGEEFAILLVGAADARTLVSIAESIRAAVTAAPIPASGRELRVSVSAGAALAGSHGRTADELLDAADAALYRAKANGRDRVELASGPTPQALAG